MDYQKLVDRVKELDFIKDQDTADAAVKAVFGIFVSRMKEEDAREFTEGLSEPLTLENLRSHQAGVTNVKPEDYIGVLANQFKISEAEAEKLEKHILRNAKEYISEEKVNMLKERLPKEWNVLTEV